MPNVARFGDSCSGHGCWPSRPNNQASDNVFINNLGAHRLNDSWQVHCCTTCHSGVLAQGSPTVFVNGKELARIGDPISCGSAVIQGSPTVFAGD